uniref:Putative secreted protein n=1 Tax=Ixodes ricinus TaxID=34613 RepID=A0A6B0ULD5_IXORI
MCVCVCVSTFAMCVWTEFAAVNASRMPTPQGYLNPWDTFTASVSTLQGRVAFAGRGALLTEPVRRPRLCGLHVRAVRGGNYVASVFSQRHSAEESRLSTSQPNSVSATRAYDTTSK